MRDDNLSIGFSKRTFQRDIREIRNIFGIDIEFSASQKGYFISQSEYENMSFQRMIEAFDLFNSLNLAQDLKPFIHLEKRRPQGTENIYGLLHAIKNRLQIEFSYKKFWENEPQNRVADPYALKEFKNRWYVLAKDSKDGLLKSFALDRLSNLSITTRSFEYPKSIDIEEYYRYCFGIVSPNGIKPVEIILSFDPYQGKYIKSLPLHDTQEILIDNKEELKIRLKLCITYDFIMEILSFGGDVKVIRPKSLINYIKDGHKKGYYKYKEID
ncbi:MAG: WYL domain-containing protein [Bacteroidales bacterium]|jgi:predicted DNA-binding transcriptional regulator YafY|nr:WYL domain-containing protein [Bacteroidales bacterium]